VPYLWLTISFAAHSLFCVSIYLEKYHVSLIETVYLRVKSPLCGTRLFIENMQWHQGDLNFPRVWLIETTPGKPLNGLGIPNPTDYNDDHFV
jgi:hypothetical protein